MVGLHQEDQILAVMYDRSFIYFNSSIDCNKAIYCEKNNVTYFTSFSNIIINIIKQLIEYCNVTSLNPKKDKLKGDNLCQHVGKCCCPKCILDKFDWNIPFLAWHHVAEKRCWSKCLNRLKNVDWLLKHVVAETDPSCWST